MCTLMVLKNVWESKENGMLRKLNRNKYDPEMISVLKIIMAYA